MSVNSYKAYFHDKAVRHRSLRHNPACDGPSGPIGGKRFTLFTQEDVVAGLRSSIPDSPVLHLHLYDLKLQDNEAYDHRGHYTAGFMITQKAGVNDTNAQATAYAACEQIAEDIIASLMYDERTLGLCSFPLGIIDWNSLDLSFLGPLWDSRYGCFVTFRYQTRRDSMPDQARIDQAFINDQIFEEQFDKAFE